MRRFPFLFIAGMTVSALGCYQPPGDDTSSGEAPSFMVALQVATPSSLPECTRALAGTTAYVASPAGLWSCQGVAWGQIPCTKDIVGAVAYASATKTLWACTSGQWTTVELPDSSLITQTQEPKGAHCAAGGTRIQSGLDQDGDGVLAAGEVSTTTYVCNGLTGECADVDHAMLDCPWTAPKLLRCDPGFVDLDGIARTGCERKSAIFDGGFEHPEWADQAGWTTFNSVGVVYGDVARSGSHAMYLGAWVYVKMEVDVPADATTLRFWSSGDGMVSLRRPNAGPLGQLLLISGAFQEGSVSMIPYRGTKVAIYFESGSYDPLSGYFSIPGTLVVDDLTLD